MAYVTRYRRKNKMPLLDIRNLTIEVDTPDGRVKALENANITIGNEEIHGIIGESGSGKSLLAKAILGIYDSNWRITADRMQWDHVNLLDLSSSERQQLMGSDIAMIFQEPSTCLNPALTIGQQMLEATPASSHPLLFWKHTNEKKKSAISWLHKVGIKNHQQILKSYPWELSEGACQKIMIAMTLANQPRLIIADEPTNAMDISTQAQIFRLLCKLNQVNGISVLLISHDLESIASWSDRLTVLYCGQTIESGASQDLLHSPYHPYTQALLDNIAEFGKNKRPKSTMPTLKGHIPSLQHLPVGCRLGPRCPYAQRKCIEFPPIKKVKQHFYACHYPLNQKVKSHDTHS